MYAIFTNGLDMVLAVRDVPDMDSAALVGQNMREQLRGAEIHGYKADERLAVRVLEAMESASEPITLKGIKALLAKSEQRHEPCGKCGGSGEYRWGAIVNGVASHSGKCFDCKGKGYMDASDVRRDTVYHNKYERLDFAH